jgi:hypothetical protein
MEYWSNGVMEYWNNGRMGKNDTDEKTRKRLAKIKV